MLSANLLLIAGWLENCSALTSQQIHCMAVAIKNLAEDAASFERMAVPHQAREIPSDPKVINLADARKGRRP